MHHTGDRADHLKGHFECTSCKGLITMHGNYKDVFPPCPYERIGADYVQVKMLDYLTDSEMKKEALS